MIEETKEKLKKIGTEQYLMNLLILVFTFGANYIAKEMKYNYYINYMITGIVLAIYLAYYKIYLINVIDDSKNKKVTKKMFFNILICNYILVIIMSRVAEVLTIFLSKKGILVWILFTIGYIIMIILNMMIAPIEYTFFEKDYVFFEGVIKGIKLLNKKKKILVINNIKILGTHILNIITIKLFTIKSNGLIFGINYNSIL
ncbi:MAG: hypothetical protein ACRC28_10545 [Clostridium sp.]|uniref:hypothetical protein n=1 Tax=Clostridium sp. TaxID=1506 RepID=UPI003F3BCBFE